jgi:hypothetical protein
VLTISETSSSVDSALSFWERVEYVAEAFVILGCVGEYLAEFTNLLPKSPIDRREQCNKISLLLLTAALAVELAALFQTNNLSGIEIARLQVVAEKAREHAAELESLFAPRRLTGTQKAEALRSLSKYSGISVDLFALAQEDRPSTVEAADFGRDVVEGLGAFMDVRGHTGMGCQSWPVVGVLVEAVQDLSPDRYAAGELLQFFKSTGFEVVPYVPPVQVPPCAAFLEMPRNTTKHSDHKGWAKVVIIIGKRAATLIKPSADKVH